MTASAESSVTMVKPNLSTLPSIYNTFLCKDLLSRASTSEEDLLGLPGPRLEKLKLSAESYSKQSRLRAVERLQLETARIYMEEKEWRNAIRILIPLWQTISWRQAGWWHLVEDIDWALNQCARNVGDAETLLAVEWELMNNSFTAKQDWHYDFSRCLEKLNPLEIKPKAVLQSEKIKSCLSASFAFSSPQGYVGEILSSQLIIVSQAHDTSVPIILDQIKLDFSGGQKNVKFLHDVKAESTPIAKNGFVQLLNVPLQPTSVDIDASKGLASRQLEASNFLFGKTDLTIAPGTTKVLAFESIPRESGDIEVASITLCINAESFDLEIVVTDVDQLNTKDIWVQNMKSVSKRPLLGDNNTIVKILPKPPKIRIEILDPRKSYLTDELVNLIIEIFNGEGASTDIILEAQLLGLSGKSPKFKWATEEGISQRAEQDSNAEVVSPSNARIQTISLGELNPGDTRTRKLSIQSGPETAEYSLELKAFYHLLSDPDTPIFKSFETELTFIRPFEANYNVSPRIHRAPWPSYFCADDDDDFDKAFKNNITPHGLCQEWLLTARIVSFAIENIVIENVRLKLLEDLDDIVCKISQPKGYIDTEALIRLKKSQNRQFELEVQKYNLEDRRTTALNLQLEVQWRCAEYSGKSAITNIAVPEMIISFGEPRVLAFVKKEKERGGLVYLDYTIENPSQFMLMFSLTMETSEEFAFSGPKAMSLQLVPLSRHTIRYNLLPLSQGDWISPIFRVVDIHFNKTLKVNATEGIKSDPKGLYVWVGDGDQN